MGANFQTLSLLGSLSEAQVRDEFAKAQDQDRYENGHSYSGGFGMATGIGFPADTFRNVKDAEEWLSNNCEKWGDALAVKHQTLDGVQMYLIGANCAS